MAERRTLQFETWQQVEADLGELQQGYIKVGNWELDQCAQHLNDWLRFPMDGFPPAPFPMSWIFAAVRATVGASMLRKILAERKMKDGIPTSPATVHQHSDVSTQDSLDKLRATIHRFQEFDGQIKPSPIFGAMDKATAERLQLVHFAHHLSWLVPIHDQNPPANS